MGRIWERAENAMMKRREKVKRLYDDMLNEGEKPVRAKTLLAKRFHVSTQTIYNDLNYMNKVYAKMLENE